MNIPKPNVSVVTSQVRRVTALPKKKLAIIFLVLLTVVGVGGYMIWKNLHKKPAKLIVTMNGKQYVVEDYTTKNAKVTVSKPDRNTEIQLLEAKVAKKDNVTYQDYLGLAQLYELSGNKPKAIENYKLAKQAADPKMSQYASFVRAIDASIIALEASK